MRLPLLQVRDLRIGFQAEDVVKGISFNLDLGEKLALVGESGSGKSVTALSFVKLLEGARVSGRVLWTPQDSETLKPEATDAPQTWDLVKLNERQLVNIRGQDIAFVFQEPMTALNPLMMVGAQIAEVLEIKRGMSREEAWHEAIELLKITGITEPVRRASTYPHQLSGGQRQRVMIAMALACRPRLLVADEPTTALDVSLRAQILDLLNDLQKQFGMAVLLITHDLNTVRRFADQVLVMEKGVIVESGAVDVVLSYPSHPYTQKLIDSQPPRHVVEAKANSPVVMQARSLRVRYPIRRSGWRGWFKGDHFVAVQAASFDLRAGQTLGVIGESGSGKTTLALAALGLMPSEGTLTIEGAAWQGHAAHDLPLRRKVQVVFQDPFSSLSPRMNVQELVSEGLTLHAPELDHLGRLRRMLVTLAAVGLTETEFAGLLQRYPHEFSGGQRQRLAIARALVVEPQVLVLDEPTSALDATTQLQVLQLLQKLQRERGLSYLLITHDVSVIRAMAHHVMVMQAGQVVEAGTFEQVLNNPQAPYTKILLGAAS
ncbi:ABC transporter ATP-binding protein [Limnohabitans sp.]|jgi:microcin C transport system ATP-binding protein|uniref:ABC transporter ATP-binding protein n=1 Tax=Limnohabitans sp. TaxID=1907725 RepID=UPI002FDED001